LNYLAIFCFFVSGVAGLVLEVLWTKMLTLVFGSTTLAVSTTVAAFMGGLSLGAFTAPRLLRRIKNPLLCYAVLEGAIGLYALAVPHMLGAMPSLQSVLWPVLYPHPAVYSLVRFVVTFAVILVPTTAMGATLPILAGHFVDGAEESGAKVGYLYALNTAGALCGTMLSGFLLIPALGVRFTNALAASLDLAVAAVLIVANHVLLPARAVPETASVLPPRQATKGPPAFLLFVAVVAGFASMALQMLWTRALSVVIGSSTYSFTVILSAFLAGISIGAALYARVLRSRRDTVGDLSMVLAGIGVSALLCSVYIDRLPFLLQEFLEIDSLSMIKLHVFNFILAWLVIFLPTLGMGAFFPLVVHLCIEDSGGISRDVGRLYSFNTIGNIFGASLTAFVIIPAAGIRLGLVSMVAAYLLLSALVAVVFRKGELSRQRWIQAGISLALAVLTVAWNPAWDVGRWSVGMFRIYLARGVYSRQPYTAPKILYHRDGMVTTVTVEGRETGVSLKVNGKVDASNGGDMATQILSGAWPMLLHGDAKKVAMVGYGSGVTAGAILRFPLESFKVVELEEAVFEGARFFDEYNHRPWSDPRMQAIVDDGRNYLAATGEKFDVIVSEPSNPWVSGASNLFTREFWEIASGRLNPGGVFAQWLQLYELSSDNIKSLIRTYHTVFPHVFILHARTGSNDTLMMGSNRPFKLDWKKLSDLMSRPGIREEFQRAEAVNPHDLLALLLMDETSIPGLVKNAPLNTDDNSLIEFSAPKDLMTYAMQDADVPPPRTVEGRLVEAIEPMVMGKPTGEAEAGWLCELSRAMVRKGRYEEARRIAVRAEKAAVKDGAAHGQAAAGGCDPSLALRTVDLLTGKESIFPFDTAGREGAGQQWGYLVQLLSADNYTAAYGMLSPPDKGEMATVNVPGATISFPRPIPSGNPARDFLRGYLLYYPGSTYEALYIWEALAADPATIEKYPMINYFISRARLQISEYLRAMEAMEKYAATVGTKEEE
jgi:spermidine synthase